MQENIGEEIDGERQIGVDHLGVKTGVLPSREGIQGSATESISFAIW